MYLVNIIDAFTDAILDTIEVSFEDIGYMAFRLSEWASNAGRHPEDLDWDFADE